MCAHSSGRARLPETLARCVLSVAATHIVLHVVLERAGGAELAHLLDSTTGVLVILPHPVVVAMGGAHDIGPVQQVGIYTQQSMRILDTHTHTDTHPRTHTHPHTLIKGHNLVFDVFFMFLLVLWTFLCKHIICQAGRLTFGTGELLGVRLA